uniref:DNA-directed DNA polymerase n=1 Tax=viral metagenome TaxID=1070528 RepID=A0A6C0H989_9ZZZZ
MLNKIIIDKFTMLLYNISKINQKDFYRYKNIKNALNIIKKLPYNINLTNVEELYNITGIGKGTINRIIEILKTGDLEELNIYSQYEDKLFNKLIKIIGIGKNKALELINYGITSISDLKKQIKENKIKVSRIILLGLKYYNKCVGSIPRNEITEIKKMIDYIIIEINKYYKLNNDNKYIFEICGSYRRNQETSGDIDILISKKNETINHNHLINFVTILKLPIKLNNNKPFIIDDITNQNFKTKYMGFCKFKDNYIRRVDIRFVPWDSYYTALLYFTGSANTNKIMRMKAKKMGYLLSEYSLVHNNNNNKYIINSEKDIFDILNLEYIEPKYR